MRPEWSADKTFFVLPHQLFTHFVVLTEDPGPGLAGPAVFESHQIGEAASGVHEGAANQDEPGLAVWFSTGMMT
jgi:hypothetical protein